MAVTFKEFKADIALKYNGYGIEIEAELTAEMVELIQYKQEQMKKKITAVVANAKNPQKLTKKEQEKFDSVLAQEADQMMEFEELVLTIDGLDKEQILNHFKQAYKNNEALVQMQYKAFISDVTAAIIELTQKPR